MRAHTFRCLLALALLATAAPRPGRGAEEIAVAIMEFSSKGGVTPEQVEALADLLASEVRDLGGFRVIGQADIRTVLGVEEKRLQAGGCTETSCMAEIGGALGVRWVLAGNVSKFGEVYLLNLKLIDAPAVRVASSVSPKVEGGEAALIDALKEHARAMLSRARAEMGGGAAAPAGAQVEGAAPPAPADWRLTWGHVTFWTGLGLVALGGVGFWQAEVAADDWEYSGSDSDASRHRTWNGVAYAGFGVGGALMITGAVLWILAAADDAPPAVSALGGPTPDGQGFSLGLGGRF
ncbi:MAG TPA: hypothetical protein PK668_15905 [Myxococcota bacterium]|nr:hypothetical protein [Myxococcota bacterium]HRY94381.1 hypothetical protein [Myxococcota bacterium]HSA20005.1 hypothetical protein [Myxococcota bacterium]